MKNIRFFVAPFLKKIRNRRELLFLVAISMLFYVATASALTSDYADAAFDDIKV